MRFSSSSAAAVLLVSLGVSFGCGSSSGSLPPDGGGGFEGGRESGSDGHGDGGACKTKTCEPGDAARPTDGSMDASTDGSSAVTPALVQHVSGSEKPQKDFTSTFFFMI